MKTFASFLLASLLPIINALPVDPTGSNSTSSGSSRPPSSGSFAIAPWIWALIIGGVAIWLLVVTYWTVYFLFGSAGCVIGRCFSSSKEATNDQQSTQCRTAVPVYEQPTIQSIPPPYLGAGYMNPYYRAQTGPYTSEVDQLGAGVRLVKSPSPSPRPSRPSSELDPFYVYIPGEIPQYTPKQQFHAL